MFADIWLLRIRNANNSLISSTIFFGLLVRIKCCQVASIALLRMLKEFYRSIEYSILEYSLRESDMIKCHLVIFCSSPSKRLATLALLELFSLTNHVFLCIVNGKLINASSFWKRNEQILEFLIRKKLKTPDLLEGKAQKSFLCDQTRICQKKLIVCIIPKVFLSVINGLDF